MFGFKISYTSDDQDAFFKDIQNLKSTIFASFPLIFEKIYKAISLKLKSLPENV
jgi:long-subunit acyl-CoA synthetase (AMP-forming)